MERYLPPVPQHALSEHANIVTVNKTYESERDSDHGQHHNCL
jgi:hypothetical protein